MTGCSLPRAGRGAQPRAQRGAGPGHGGGAEVPTFYREVRAGIDEQGATLGQYNPLPSTKMLACAPLTSQG